MGMNDPDANDTVALCDVCEGRVLRLDPWKSEGTAYCVRCDFWYTLPSPAVRVVPLAQWRPR